MSQACGESSACIHEGMRQVTRTVPVSALPGVRDSFALEHNLGHVPHQGHFYHS